MIEDTSWPTGWRRFELWFVSSLPDVSLGREQDTVDMQPANVYFEEMSDGEKDTHAHTHTHTHTHRTWDDLQHNNPDISLYLCTRTYTVLGPTGYNVTLGCA